MRRQLDVRQQEVFASVERLHCSNSGGTADFTFVLNDYRSGRFFICRKYAADARIYQGTCYTFRPGHLSRYDQISQNERGPIMTTPNIYRNRVLNEISESDVGKTIRVAGWVENIRDHGGVSFIDLRDMYGVLQVVLRDTSLLDGITKENCISIEGVIDHRDEETYNPKIPTGTIELEAHSIDMLGKVYRQLPFEIMTSKEIREDVRLKYRYLDLRNQKVKDNIIFRSQVISFLRQKMTEMGFLEIQTPILCASSPEGARDYIVPSRKFKGRFYALPQAPQQYKQLLMVSGFDKYSRSHHVSVMRMPAQTVHRVNSISWTLR